MTKPSPNFQVTTSARTDAVCLTCTGELDLSSMSQLEDGVSAAMETAPMRLLIDMERVTFIDSAGVRVIWNAAQRCANRSITIAIIPSEPVNKLFKLLQLELPTAKPPEGAPASSTAEPA
jgi:anti-anti-sigma factor